MFKSQNNRAGGLLRAHEDAWEPWAISRSTNHRAPLVRSQEPCYSERDFFSEASQDLPDMSMSLCSRKSAVLESSPQSLEELNSSRPSVKYLLKDALNKTNRR